MNRDYKNLKIVFFTLLLSNLCIIFNSCKTKSNNGQEGLIQLNSKRLIWDTSVNELYFKSDSIFDNQQDKHVRFISICYSEKFDEGYKELKDVIDTASFEQLDFNTFKDNKYIYKYYLRSDGGSLSIIDSMR